MLSLNTIKFSCKDDLVLKEIFNILNVKSVKHDINNYHTSSSNNIEFLSLFFDGVNPPYEYFGFDWAYIESCEKTDIILATIYSYNGNLSIWVSEIIKKYKESELDIYIETVKSVKFKNYENEPTWIESKPIDPPTILTKKKGL